MKKLLGILVLGLLWCNTGFADDTCVDKNPEIILDLGGSSEPEKIIYATYDSCTKMHDYCGAMGCALDVFDDKGKYALGYIAKDDWYIRPAKVLGKKPTYELVIPGIDSLLIISVINDKLTETAVNK